MSANSRRVLIIGGNFAGLVAASRLSCAHDVTVVDGRDEFEWTPNIHELLSGVKDRASVVLPRAACVKRYGHRFVHDRVTSLDAQSGTAETASGQALPFDACIVAAGSRRTNFGLEGGGGHAHDLRLVDDAVRIAGRLDALSRRRRRAAVTIVGGGVTGIEVAGELLRRDGRRFDIHLIESAASLLPGLPDALGQDAAAHCAENGVEVHTGAPVAGVEADAVHLSDGTRLASDLCIWSAGMALPEFLLDSDLRIGDDEWLAVDDTLASLCADNVFVAGDCAALPDPLRKQAYHAMDMGKVAGDNAARWLDDRDLRRYRAAATPMLVAFGDVTTWLVAAGRVVASPALAAAKEAVYQATMARLASPHEPLDYAAGLAGRAALAGQKLLLPQLLSLGLLGGLTGTRILQP